jgi:hypothetical protein
MTCIAGRRKLRNAGGAPQIAEFAPALYVLFIIVLMPLLDLATTFVAGATQYLASNDFVAKAATQPDYPTALNSMANEAYQFQSSGLAQFVHMAANGGYTGCGDDLFVLSTDIASGTVTSSAANQPLGQPINTKNTMYEFSVRSQYSVSPLVNLSAVPLLGAIPGLGKPMEFVFVANRPVEHPGGLQAASGGNVVGGGSVTPFARVPGNPAVAATPSSVTWRTPAIYSLIQAAGQTVVNANVIIVQANNPNWTTTGLTISSGQKIWIDTNASGSWSVGGVPPYPAIDANGYAGANVNGGPLVSAPGGSLVGKVGTAGPPFLVGDDRYNYPPAGTGALAMIINDGFMPDNTGAQMVRIIIVQ